MLGHIFPTDKHYDYNSFMQLIEVYASHQVKSGGGVLLLRRGRSLRRVGGFQRVLFGGHS